MSKIFLDLKGTEETESESFLAFITTMSAMFQMQEYEERLGNKKGAHKFFNQAEKYARKYVKELIRQNIEENSK